MSIDKHYTCLISEVLDVPFSKPILLVSIYSTKGDNLIGFLNCCSECFARKSCTDTMAVLDLGVMPQGKMSKGFLCFDRLFTHGGFLSTSIQA
jgi:hypothetical protein